MDLTTFKFNHQRDIEKLKKKKRSICPDCGKYGFTKYEKREYVFVENSITNSTNINSVKIQTTYCFDCDSNWIPNYSVAKKTLIATIPDSAVKNEGFEAIKDAIRRFKDNFSARKKAKLRSEKSLSAVIQNTKRVVRRTKLHSPVKIVFQKNQLPQNNNKC